MKIEPISLMHANPIARDYVQRQERIAARYSGFPQEEAVWRKRIAYLTQGRELAADRRELAAALAEYNRRIGNHPAALDQIERLASPEALVVIGGQQAGLFTGPLLVIYKAITILRQAREAAKRYQRPVVPVFWIAGEDHDLAEVDHIHLLRAGHQIHRLQLAKQDQDRVSISHLPISPEDWQEALRGLAQALPDTELKPELIETLTSICRDSHTLSEAFARIMARLFGAEGLVLIDSADPAVRRVEAPMWKQLILHNAELHRAYLTAQEALIKAGYHPQAEVHADSAHLFYYEDQKRLLLYRRGDGFADRFGQVRLTKEELLQIAEEEPAKLSNNVLTRPLMQDYLFPVLAVVLGPGEIAYWGQLKEAFACLGMELPVIVPREGYTLVEPGDQKLLERFGMTVEDVFRRLAEKREAWLRSQETFDVEEKFAAAAAQIRGIYKPLIEQAGEVNAVMRSLGEANLRRILTEVDYYRKRINAEIEAKHAAGLRQFDRLERSLNPGGVPQERVYNVFAYLNRYGDGWLRALLAEHRPDPLDGVQHHIVYL